MANIVFAEQENACLHPPSLKMRERLQSAPSGEILLSCSCLLYSRNICEEIYINLLYCPFAEKLLKSPMFAKNFNTPLASGRRAFGTVSNKVSTPAVNPQERKLLKPQVGRKNLVVIIGK